MDTTANDTNQPSDEQEQHRVVHSGNRVVVRAGQSVAVLVHGDALAAVSDWPTPTSIVVDGPYGVSGYPGDPPTPEHLPAWYELHVAAWSAASDPTTTLWFWGTELSWALVHPVLAANGWEYKTFHVWDKGIAHIAGNVNGKTIRRFPIVSEACVQYARIATAETIDGRQLPLQQWLREEWLRSGLPLCKTNEAAGVANAATRKYFTADHLWYFPPPEIMAQVAAFANEHGLPTDRPYFSLDGSAALTPEAWARMRTKWNHKHGITNVWSKTAVRGSERLKDEAGKIIHTNQKPLELMSLIIEASTDQGDVVWEPFGGLCTASVAALKLGRNSYAAELDARPFRAAAARLLYTAEQIEAAAAVCAPWDLAVVCPWALSEVISGTPVLFEPYAVPARAALAS